MVQTLIVTIGQIAVASPAPENPNHSGNTLGHVSDKSFQHNTLLLRHIVSIVFFSSADLSHHYTDIK